MIRETLAVALAWTAIACDKSADEPKEHAAAEESAKGESHKDEAVHMSAEAVERASIRVGLVERRALSGGVAIPADVQFDPGSTAHVSPLMPGRLVRVAVSLGDRVKSGQLLGVVASTDVSEARARLDQARARLSAAESTFKRQQQLSSEGIGAQRSLIEAEAQVGQVRAEVEGIRGQLSVFGSGRAGELGLMAPIAGVLVGLHATLGEMTSPEQAVFIITDPAKVSVRGNVPELEIANVQQGSAAIVRVHAFPDLSMRGIVTYVAPSLDEATRSLPIRVTLDAPDARLRSGLFGSIELVGGKADERVVVVPVEALATLEGQSAVFVPGDEQNSFKPHTVALGRRAGGIVEVRSGLTEGQRVVVSGVFTLKSALQSSELSEGHEN